MKKRVLISGFALVLSLYSCNDALDIRQAGEMNEEAVFQTVNDVRLGMYRVYGVLSNTSQIDLSSVWCDEAALGNSNGGQGVSDGRLGFIMNTGSDYAASIWGNGYSLINFANRVLRGASYVTPNTPQEETEYNDYLAQVRALRAYGHFMLMTYFSADLTNDNALGIIKMDRVPEMFDKIGRSTNKEIYDFIDEDLTFAAANLNPATATSPIYVTPNFIKALKARMYLYRAGNNTALLNIAEENVDAFIGLPATNRLALAARTQYPAIWQDAAGASGLKEIIFKLERVTGNEAIASLWQSVDNSISGSSFFEVGRALYNLLDADNNGNAGSLDIRESVIVNLNPTTGSIINPDYQNSEDYLNTDVLLINKYPGGPEGIKRLNDIKIFRTSEMYLIKAEIQIRKGDLEGASQTLHALRTARFSASTVGTRVTFNNATEAYKFLLKERRLELAFEGHRYVDLKRLGVLAGESIDRDPKDCSLVNFPNCTIPIDHRFTLPIPADEIATNTAIKGQQNPGY